MTAPTIKIKVFPKNTIKGKMDVRFPANVQGEIFIAVRRANGTYYLTPDYSQLVPLPAPDGDKVVAIWDSGTGDWNTTTLSSIANGVSDIRQNVTGASATIAAGTTLVTINRFNPTATALQLPPIFDQGGSRLSIVDYSTGLTGDHTITLTPFDPTTKIVGKATWSIFSTATQPGSLTLRPSTDMNDWYIAP